MYINHNLTDHAIQHVQSLADSGAHSEAWRHLHENGDSYTDDAANVTGCSGIESGEAIQTLVEKHWVFHNKRCCTGINQ